MACIGCKSHANSITPAPNRMNNSDLYKYFANKAFNTPDNPFTLMSGPGISGLPGTDPGTGVDIIECIGGNVSEHADFCWRAWGWVNPPPNPRIIPNPEWVPRRGEWPGFIENPNWNPEIDSGFPWEGPIPGGGGAAIPPGQGGFPAPEVPEVPDIPDPSILDQITDWSVGIAAAATFQMYRMRWNCLANTDLINQNQQNINTNDTNIRQWMQEFINRYPGGKDKYGECWDNLMACFGSVTSALDHARDSAWDAYTNSVGSLPGTVPYKPALDCYSINPVELWNNLTTQEATIAAQNAAGQEQAAADRLRAGCEDAFHRCIRGEREIAI